MRPSLFPIPFLVGCAGPAMESYFVQLQTGTAADQLDAAGAFVERIDAAEQSVLAALPGATDTTVAASLVAAWEAGLRVEVVTDIDSRADEGIQLIEDAGIPLRYADGPVSYFDFVANDVVAWDSDQVIMSHAFVVVDDLHVVNATGIGGAAGGAQIVFRASNEDLADDFVLEHNQLMGGSDATALTAFSAPAKSQTDIRWVYPSADDAVFELWFGPQERITKRVIDAIYTARRSVRVMSNEVANDGIARALQDKSSWGFDVELIVGPDFGSTLRLLEDQIVDETPDVRKYRFTDADDLPTLILIDIEGPDGDLDVLPRAYVLSHDLFSASRFFEDRQGRMLEVTTDQLIDGNLCVITDENHRWDGSHSDPASQLAPLIDLYMDHLDRAGAF